MAQTGAVPFSLKSDLGWRGMTTSKALPYHFDLIENGYVSSDGSEIRSFPGFVCVVDPATRTRLYSDATFAAAPFGYESACLDSRRWPYQLVTNYNRNRSTGFTEDHWIWNRPTSIHSVLQVNGRWFFIGEGGHRFSPIVNSTGMAIVYVTRYENIAGPAVRLTLSDVPAKGSTTPNAITTYKQIYLEGLVGTLAAALNGKSHIITVVGATNTIDIGTDLGGTETATGQTGLISNVTLNRRSGVSTTYDGDGTGISDDKDSLQVWYTSTRPDVDTDPIDRVWPAHVANRQRDYGDDPANLNEGQDKVSAYAPRSRRRQKGLPFRVVPHVAGSRLVIAAPGYGCAFQVPTLPPIDPSVSSVYAGQPWYCNDIYDRPRALGVPKAVLWQDPETTIADSYHNYEATTDAYAWGGSAHASRAGVYKFKFAYRDEITGEAGLCSEPITLSSVGGAYTRFGLRIRLYFPGYLLHESLALSLNVYRTKKGGDTYYFDRTIPVLGFEATGTDQSAKYGLKPQSTTNDRWILLAQYDAIWMSDDDLGAQVGYVPDVLEQMPMGCKASRTIRGWTFLGGHLGDAGLFKEMRYGTLSLEYDKNTYGDEGQYYEHNVVSSIYSYSSFAGKFQGEEIGFGCAANNIPPAYMGQRLVSHYLFPYPRNIVLLHKMVNMVGGYSGANLAFHDVRYQIMDAPLRKDTDAINGFRSKDAYLLLPRGHLQISEADNPGVVPATNTAVICPDNDIEGIGDAGGVAVIASRTKTYAIGFSTSPVGAPGDLVSDQFGCIAANSMVSFDGGCAWLSDRGPVAMMGGGVQWIGQPLERLFVGETARYLRDKDGMMRHSWACHDAERGLLLFGVFADRGQGSVSVSYRGTSYTWAQSLNYSTSREIQSRFPCDEVLIYNYRSQAWSVWRPPLWLPVQWMANGYTADGVNRVHFLGHDKRLYVLDDAYNILDKEANYIELTTSGSVTNIQDVGIATGLKIRVGQDVAFYSGGGTTPLTLIGTRTVASIVAVDEFTLSSAITLPAGGCKMLVGPRTMTIRSTSANWKKGEAASVGKVGVRYSLHSMLSLAGDPAYDEQAAFWSVEGTSATSRDRVTTPVTQSLTTDSAGDYQPLAETSATEQVFERDSANGRITGKNTQVEFTFIGGAQVRVSDLYVEVQ